MNILVVDDQPILCYAIEKYIEELERDPTESAIKVTSVHSLPDAIAALPDLPHPAVIFLDLGLGTSQGSATLANLQKHNQNHIPVVVYTGLPLSDDETSDIFRECLYEHNALTVVVKTTDLKTMFRGLPRILDGEKWLSNEVIAVIGRKSTTALDLTPRQIDVLQLMARGLRNKEIAAELNKAPEYIQQVTGHIFKRLGVHSRWAAAEMFRNAKKSGRNGN